MEKCTLITENNNKKLKTSYHHELKNPKEQLNLSQLTFTVNRAGTEKYPLGSQKQQTEEYVLVPLEKALKFKNRKCFHENSKLRYSRYFFLKTECFIFRMDNKTIKPFYVWAGQNRCVT